ncbi:exonuclease subunit SbcD, partial [uncultured Dialister sp.]|uniref:metallophosphoesterase family protein n=1 Tax=uncultured Dialister sp. TaxID=278064 RepID=UPI0025FF2D56
MKFIHTADWHLGKLLKEHSMTEDQAWLLENRFLPLVDEEKPDVILLSGDVYDRSYPPEEAVELFDRMTEEIVGKRKIPFIIISGNHDSPERLSFGGRLMSSRKVFVAPV